MRRVVVIPLVQWAPRAQRCIDSLVRSGWPITDVVIVVDGGVPDVPSDLTGQGITVVARHRRGGYAAACNSGFRAVWPTPGACSDDDVVVFLNDDVVVPPGWQTALDRLATDEVGVVGFSVDGPGGPRPRHAGRRVEGGTELASPTLAGCAFALRARDYSLAGGIDEQYVMYGEESDLFTRLMRQGCTLVEDSTVVWHEEEATVSSHRFRRAYYGIRGPVRLAVLTGSWWSIFRSIGAMMVHVCLPRRIPVGDGEHIRRKRSLVWPLRVGVGISVAVMELATAPWRRARRAAASTTGHLWRSREATTVASDLRPTRDMPVNGIHG